MTNENENFLHRITGFSDAVFAVAITLLILDMRIPELSGSVSNADFLTALTHMGPKLWTFTLSFFVIGRYWVSHVRHFQFFRTIIEGEKPRLLFLTLLFLFFIVLLPFSTSLISAYSDQRLAVVIYAATVAAAGYMQYSMWVYATHEHTHKISDTEKRQLYYQTMRLLATPFVFTLSIPIAFYSIHGAEYFWLLILFVRTQILKRQRSL